MEGAQRTITSRLRQLLLFIIITTQLGYSRSSRKPRLITLRDAGPSTKVVDVVLISEAYTHEDDFLADATRLSSAIFDIGGAYADLAPVISVHGLFVASQINHVGKAGGGSVRTTFAKTGLLHNDNCCVGNKLVDVWHPYGNLVPQLEHSYIVLNVRDPVDR